LPSINMISPRRAEKRRLEANVRRLVVVILAEAIATVLVCGFMVSKILRAQSGISDLQITIAKLQPTVAKIDYYEKATGELKPKLDTLNQAKSITLRWQRVLDNLSVSMPDKTWLTRIAAQSPATPEAKEMVVSMNGVSASQQLVGETMLRIQNSVRDFDHLDLHFTQKSASGGQDAVEFEIAASVKLDTDDKDKTAAQGATGEVSKS
jgi:Tfp pilus assembly protein PilN